MIETYFNSQVRDNTFNGSINDKLRKIDGELEMVNSKKILISFSGPLNKILRGLRTVETGLMLLNPRWISSRLGAF